MAYLPQMKSFFRNTITMISMYLLATFIMKNFKKSSEQIQSYDDAPFLGPKWSVFPERKFFQKTRK